MKAIGTYRDLQDNKLTLCVKGSHSEKVTLMSRSELSSVLLWVLPKKREKSKITEKDIKSEESNHIIFEPDYDLVSEAGKNCF